MHRIDWKFFKRKIYYLIAVLTSLFLGILSSPIQVKAKEPVVIVIDPGHGGENLGGEYKEYTEKEMTMTVARAMKAELEKYDQVIVYLTRDADIDMSLEERAVFAKEKNADFLFCLHFNLSVKHDFFGAEVWVPAGGEYYAKGYSFAQIQMNEFTEIGLYSRGIKTRLNDKGDNYYGILRHCSNEQIPSVLIEHCHLDHEKDQKFYMQGEEQLKEFGRLDATAVAKYFRLKSEILGVDYSDYPVPETSLPQEMVSPDKTEPELCRIEVEEINQQTGEATVYMEAIDSDSYILYYSYSLDGGNTYTMPDAWPRTDRWDQSDPSYRFSVKLPFDEPISLKARASNGFDVWTESNVITIDMIPDPERLKEERKEEEERLQRAREKALAQLEENYPEMDNDDADGNSIENRNNNDSVKIILIILGIVLCMCFVSVFMSKLIFLLIKGNKKR